jgi:hypothetical protein
VPTAQSLGLEPDNVLAVMGFLLDRAAAHVDENSSPSELQLLCAATLRRDAAAIAIILDDYDKAAKLLRTAGYEYMKAGSFYGLALLSVIDTSPPWEDFQDRVTGLGRQFFRPIDDETDGQDEVAERFSAAEAVSALQALSVTIERDAAKEHLRHQLSGTFQRFPIHAGAPELRTPFYFRVLQQASSIDVAARQFAARDLYALSDIRDAELEAAQADEYHWALLLNPSDVVGFDLMFVGLSALRHNQSLAPMVEAFGELESATALPFKAALNLAKPIG